MNKKITCRHIDGTTTEVSADKLVFRPSVYGVVIKDSKVLLVPQWDGYDVPGGGIDKGESIKDALIREAKEETGFDVVPGKLLLVSEDFFIRPKTGEPMHSILMYYACEVVGGELSSEGFSEFEKEIAKLAEWVPLEQIASLKFYNAIDTPALIRLAQAER